MYADHCLVVTHCPLSSQANSLYFACKWRSCKSVEKHDISAWVSFIPGFRTFISRIHHTCMTPNFVPPSLLNCSGRKCTNVLPPMCNGLQVLTCLRADGTRQGSMVSLFFLVCSAIAGHSVAAADFETAQLYSPAVLHPPSWSPACTAARCMGFSRRTLLNVDNGPRAPPNPVLAATPLTQLPGTGVKGTITVVNTAAQLYAALRQGSRHIDVRDHIDLTTLPIISAVEWSEPLLPEVLKETQTITVRSQLCAACDLFLMTTEAPQQDAMVKHCIMSRSIPSTQDTEGWSALQRASMQPS